MQNSEVLNMWVKCGNFPFMCLNVPFTRLFHLTYFWKLQCFSVKKDWWAKKVTHTDLYWSPVNISIIRKIAKSAFCMMETVKMWIKLLHSYAEIACAEKWKKQQRIEKFFKYTIAFMIALNWQPYLGSKDHEMCDLEWL